MRKYASPDEILWYYADSHNQAAGPVTYAELQRLAATGSISQETYVVEEGGSDWRVFADVSQPPQMMQPPPLPQEGEASAASQKTSGPWLRKSVLFAAGLCVLCLFIGLVLFTLVRMAERSVGTKAEATHKNDSAGKPAGAATAKVTFVPAGSTLYADEETLRLIDTEFAKGEASGNEATKLLRESGKMWTEEYNMLARVLREGGPMDYAQVEVLEPKGIRMGRFWVSTPLIPADSRSARLGMRKDFRRKKSDFIFTFTGNNGTEVSGADVGDLAEMIEGIYRGQIPVNAASRYLFNMEAIEAELVRVTGDYLIYETMVSRRSYQFAMRRDADFERDALKGYGSIEEFYEDIRSSQFHSENPLIQGPIMVSGTEEFVTGAGLVKVVPVVRMVNVVP